MGQLDRLRTELPESAEPIVPKHWGELNTVTIAFGHGLSVAPLQAVMGIAATAEWRPAHSADFPQAQRGRGERARQAGASSRRPATKMRYLMRLNAEKGSANEADVKGYYVGGKTGTAEKVVNGRYSKTKLLTSFTAVLPADKPRYLVLIMLDEPQAAKETHGYATAGWNAGADGGPGDRARGAVAGHRAALRSAATARSASLHASLRRGVALNRLADVKPTVHDVMSSRLALACRSAAGIVNRIATTMKLPDLLDGFRCSTRARARRDRRRHRGQPRGEAGRSVRRDGRHQGRWPALRRRRRRRPAPAAVVAERRAESAARYGCLR